ncbi:hypothetical protein ANN_05162 [Periplaneta americana]|uniref:Uncharacterized protein n=1 Tax=Periplaneta americana TaxID=6978 RepID=A0ABQ8TCV1_PERAM|nr:hypothetical protein ANN_05162 [Periplaneta americana]
MIQTAGGAGVPIPKPRNARPFIGCCAGTELWRTFNASLNKEGVQSVCRCPDDIIPFVGPRTVRHHVRYRELRLQHRQLVPLGLSQCLLCSDIPKPSFVLTNKKSRGVRSGDRAGPPPVEMRNITLTREHQQYITQYYEIFGAKRDEVTGEWRKLHNAELHALYSSPDIIRNIKSRRLRWAGYVARMVESRNAYRVLVGRPEGKRPLGRPRRRWEDNIKMALREVGYDGRDWINLAQDRDQWRAYVRAAMNLRWIPGYCDVERYQVADTLAKKGSQILQIKHKPTTFHTVKRLIRETITQSSQLQLSTRISDKEWRKTISRILAYPRDVAVTEFSLITVVTSFYIICIVSELHQALYVLYVV